MKPTRKEEKEEEDRALTQLKKTQAHVSIWGLQCLLTSIVVLS